MTIECVKCKAPNPDGKKYCGDCGAFLDPNSGPILAAIESNLEQQIQEALKERFKEQKVVEIETTQAIVVRVLDWAKILAFCVGIPLTLLLLVLGVLGIKTYSDFSTMVENARQNTEQTLQQTQRKAEEIEKEGDKLTAEYEELRNQLGEVRALSHEVENLATKVTEISELVGFKPSAALTEDLQAKLKSSFASYQIYLEKLGYRSKAGQVDVYVDPTLKDNAYYDKTRNLIVLGEHFTEDIDVVLQKYTHHVIAYAAIDGQNKPSWKAIKSGLADYFSCSFNNNALFGEKSAAVYGNPYLRNLENSMNFSDRSDRPYQLKGEIWGGAFWELRGALGKDA
ncbi:MAG: hypothetical protein GY850_29425, partial [bacterium]|nr:hypothetical protein [bacterium]